MSSKISFEGIGEVVATFACGEGVAPGQVVKVTEDGTVGACAATDKFCGVALSAEDGYAAYADVVIDNGRSFEETEGQIGELLSEKEVQQREETE